MMRPIHSWSMHRAWLIAACAAGVANAVGAEPWKRHTIDGSQGGADGTRLADVNGDGHRDIVTAWEQSGLIRIYLHPGPQAVREPWPAITVGKVPAPEDAVFVDLDGDGAMDVVSSCEGRGRTIYVHWAPQAPDDYRNAEEWTTESIPVTNNRESWMFALPLQIDGRGGIDLVVGSKGKDASISWLQAPEDPRDLSAWRLRRLRSSGWIMSLLDVDMDADGDLDILASDRKGPEKGVFWLENPGAEVAANGEPWNEHKVGSPGEVMFLTVGDVDQDGVRDIVAAVRRGGVAYWRGTNPRTAKEPTAEGAKPSWEFHEIALPAGCGTGKSVAAGDINHDGRQDIVFSCESASKTKSGVRWLSTLQPPTEAPHWLDHEISGPEGIKYDLAVLEDVDGDGDMDVITSEENAEPELGVIWYENPTLDTARQAHKSKRPNILFIVADDLGYEALGAYGGTSYATPNVDSLAAGGIRFLNSFSAPNDAASQVSMLTGNYAFRNGGEWGYLAADANTIGEAMKRARYDTVLAGKWPFAVLKQEPLHARERGFEENCCWSPQEGPRFWRSTIYQNGKICYGVTERYGPDVHCDFLIDFIRRHVAGERRFRPFFAYYPMTVPHVTPGAAPPSTSGQKRKRHPSYAEVVAEMDRLVGKLVAVLDELGLREKTLIVFTAENGTPVSVTSHLGQRQRRGGKGTLSDAGTHVPLVVNWPGTIRPGAVSEDLVDGSDFFATFLNLAGGAPSRGAASLDSRSFAAVLRGNESTGRRWVYLQGEAGKRAIRDRRWKLYGDGRLFDLLADSEEDAPIQPTEDIPDANDARRKLGRVLQQLGG